MTKKINTCTFAFLALMTLGSAASAAEGEYYHGGGSGPRFHADPMTTGSIGSSTTGAGAMPTINSGDYYQGTVRNR